MNFEKLEELRSSFSKAIMDNDPKQIKAKFKEMKEKDPSYKTCLMTSFSIVAGENKTETAETMAKLAKEELSEEEIAALNMFYSYSEKLMDALNN